MQSRRDLYVGAGFNTNSYKKTFLSAWFNLSADEAGGNGTSTGFYLEWKPKSSLLVPPDRRSASTAPTPST